jgi:ribosomal RNA-processing protein 36
MMDPASSSDDESSSSAEEVINRKPLHDDDDDDGDDSSDDNEEHHVSNFDDLPTDDSEMESDSDDDSDEDDNNESANVHDDDDEEDLPLAERVAKRAQLGRRYNDSNREDRDDDGGKKRLLERKNRAITLASERLRKARKGSNASDSSSVPSSSSDDDSSVEEATSNKGGQKKKKKSKHAPTEMSSKRRDFFARGRPDLNSSGIGVSVGANKYKPRDPRMVSLSGHLDDDVFEKRYGFLDEVQEAEIDKLKKRISAWKTTGKKGQKARKKLGLTQGNNTFENDQEELTRLLQERAERKKASLVRAAKRSVTQKIRADVASGKGVYYPKRSELRKMELEAKFEEIRKRGGDEAVDKAIAKRRKKNVAKSHKLMPSHMVK